MLHNSPKAHFTYLTRNLLNLWLVWRVSCSRMLLYGEVNVILTHCAVRKLKGWRGWGGVGAKRKWRALSCRFVARRPSLVN